MGSAVATEATFKLSSPPKVIIAIDIAAISTFQKTLFHFAGSLSSVIFFVVVDASVYEIALKIVEEYVKAKSTKTINDIVLKGKCAITPAITSPGFLPAAINLETEKIPFSCRFMAKFPKIEYINQHPALPPITDPIIS